MLSPQFHISSVPSTLDKEFYSIVQQTGKPTSIKKGKLLIKQNTHASFFFYIISGVFKTYFSIADKQYIIGFTFTGDVDCCPSALLSGESNNFNIEAVTDSEVLLCDMREFMSACSETQYEAIITNYLVKYIRVLENRMAASISLTAEQRYQELLKKQPNEVQQIPLKDIAAYLGITVERLSRIRQKHKS